MTGGQRMTSGTQAIDRAAAVLSFVVRADGPVSFTDVVEITDLAPSTVSRMLGALERNGLVQREKDNRYRAGALFATYAARFDRVEALILAAEPTLQRLSDETGETVNLAIPSSDKVVQIAQVESTFVLGATNWIGVDVPPHCSALGKVMFAEGAIPLPTAPLEKRTAHTLTSRTALLKQLQQVRAQGYAIVHKEFEDGLDAVAAPLRGRADTLLAAVSISGPSLRIADKHEQFGRLLIRELDVLSRALAADPAHAA